HNRPRAGLQRLLSRLRGVDSSLAKYWCGYLGGNIAEEFQVGSRCFFSIGGVPSEGGGNNLAARRGSHSSVIQRAAVRHHGDALATQSLHGLGECASIGARA